MKNFARKVVTYPPATLGCMLRDENDPFRALIPAYDLILMYGGSG